MDGMDVMDESLCRPHPASVRVVHNVHLVHYPLQNPQKKKSLKFCNLKLLLSNGGADGTRTHGLRRDRTMNAALPHRISVSYVASRSLVWVPVGSKTHKKPHMNHFNKAITTKFTGGNGAQRNCSPVQRLVMLFRDGLADPMEKD